MQANNRHRWFIDPVRLYAAGLHALTSWVWPLFDAASRFWVAKFFLLSGMVQAMHLDGDINVGTDHYLGDWSTSIVASGIGSTLELLSGVLFLFGLLTRVDALALLILSFAGAISPGSDAVLLVRVLLAYY
jgi:uncharacterized membrane protein YphA (DoxX/SURF4 family)